MKTILILLSASLAHAATSVAPTAPQVYSANAGWIDLRGNTSQGVSIGDFFCQGYAYAANFGWISFGNGSPTNGHTYSNSSATDFGVNLSTYSSTASTHQVLLRGYAYSANVGWINFEPQGNPRVNLITGQFQGHAYSANIGWITLNGLNINPTTTLATTDSDADGISDAWEFSRKGNLTALGSGDLDQDGFSDLAEFLADTNPDDPNSNLRITNYIAPRPLVASGPLVTSLAWTSNPTRIYAIQNSTNLENPWAFSATGIRAVGSTTPLDLTEPAAPRRFHRIVANLPLSP